MPGYEESPFWIEPQTRVCRARMLIAEGAVEDAVVDADRAVAGVQSETAFQGLCNPLAFRARLHAELGETKEAARVTAELLDVWKETRSAYLDSWLLDVWFAAWSAGEEARLTAAVREFSVAVPWLDVVSAFVERDFDKAAAQLESMASVSGAALARLWAGEWLVEQGRHADAAVQSSSARFLSGVRSARGGIYAGASRCSLPPPKARLAPQATLTMRSSNSSSR